MSGLASVTNGMSADIGLKTIGGAESVASFIVKKKNIPKRDENEIKRDLKRLRKKRDEVHMEFMRISKLDPQDIAAMHDLLEQEQGLDSQIYTLEEMLY